jgi:hypothetical protein
MGCWRALPPPLAGTAGTAVSDASVTLVHWGLSPHGALLGGGCVVRGGDVELANFKSENTKPLQFEGCELSHIPCSACSSSPYIWCLTLLGTICRAQLASVALGSQATGEKAILVDAEEKPTSINGSLDIIFERINVY